MDNYEDYILRVLHRTSSDLQDSLTPVHGSKLKKLVNQFEQTPSVVAEIQALMSVHGFAKVALVMEWLTERVKRPTEDFSPEQFESDVLLLNEKIFEAFLNQPFDMPDFGTPSIASPSHRSAQQEFQISADEFIGTAYPSGNLQHTEVYDPADDDLLPNNAVTPLEEPNTADALFTSLESSLQNATEESFTDESSPPLQDVMDAELLEITDRIASNAVELIEKLPSERVVATAVLRVNARAGADNAKGTSNVVVQDFFAALMKLINTADEMGKIKSDIFAETCRDIGDRLANARHQSANGISMLKNIIQFINDPKEILGKK
ncbi:MAG: hypothetical protein ACYC09_12715 [Bacteroidota bacterium]